MLQAGIELVGVPEHEGTAETLAVLCEVLDERGNRATRDQLVAIAARNNLKIISIEQLIAHRRVSEKLVSRIAQASIPTRDYGDFTIIAYEVKYENQQPMVLVKGQPDLAEAPLVRLHSSCFTGDLLDSLRCDCGSQLQMALELINQAGCGVLVGYGPPIAVPAELDETGIERWCARVEAAIDELTDRIDRELAGARAPAPERKPA